MWFKYCQHHRVSPLRRAPNIVRISWGVSKGLPLSLIGACNVYSLEARLKPKLMHPCPLHSCSAQTSGLWELSLSHCQLHGRPRPSSTEQVTMRGPSDVGIFSQSPILSPANEIWKPVLICQGECYLHRILYSERAYGKHWGHTLS